MNRCTSIGTITNKKGYRDLDPHVGAIYGDSVTYERAEAITANLMRQGFASTAVVFGYGSLTYQYQTRDTFKMAMKALRITATPSASRIRE
jgi:nicotinamide phosphoribosyltransferase